MLSRSSSFFHMGVRDYYGLEFQSFCAGT